MKWTMSGLGCFAPMSIERSARGVGELGQFVYDAVVLLVL